MRSSDHFRGAGNASKVKKSYEKNKSQGHKIIIYTGWQKKTKKNGMRLWRAAIFKLMKLEGLNQNGMKGHSILFNHVHSFMAIQAIQWPPWPNKETSQKKQVVLLFGRSQKTKPLFERSLL
jgi:hypothetical protein